MHVHTLHKYNTNMLKSQQEIRFWVVKVVVLSRPEILISEHDVLGFLTIFSKRLIMKTV